MRRSFTARYEGNLDADGGNLRGNQSWQTDTGSYQRSCKLRLTSKGSRQQAG
jgi:hypothetical protein